MTILTDHLSLDRSEDPGNWYVWALDFKNTFLFLYNKVTEKLKKKKVNFDTLPPQPGTLAINTIYFAAIELYMKTYLLAKKAVEPQKLRTEYSHKLNMLREKCAEQDKRFNSDDLKWIVNTMEQLTKSDWSQIKYPPKRTPLTQINVDRSEDASTVPLFGEKTMIPPLELLDEIVKPLVFSKD